MYFNRKVFALRCYLVCSLAWSRISVADCVMGVVKAVSGTLISSTDNKLGIKACVYLNYSASQCRGISH